MNSGFGSRPALGFTPDGGNVGRRLFHDIGQMLIHRERNRRRGNPERRKTNGHALMWLEPLDRNTQHELKDLDPYFIEAAQRIRLMSADRRITAALASRESTSINGKASQGNLGDHWTPIVKPDGKALSVPQNGWKPRVLMRVIGDDTEVELPTAMTIKGCEDVKRWRLVARGTAKKQGGTQGYHERCDITFDRQVVEMLRTEAGRQRIHEAGRALDKTIGKITGRLGWPLRSRLRAARAATNSRTSTGPRRNGNARSSRPGSTANSSRCSSPWSSDRTTRRRRPSRTASPHPSTNSPKRCSRRASTGSHRQDGAASEPAHPRSRPTGPRRRTRPATRAARTRPENRPPAPQKEPRGQSRNRTLRRRSIPSTTRAASCSTASTI